METHHGHRPSPQTRPETGPHIPPPPRRAWRPLARLEALTAVQEASLVGSLALVVSWSVAELALLLG